MRYLGITDINEINRLTYYDYSLLMTGVLLGRLDEKSARHEQAWLNRIVIAEKEVRKGKTEYVYKKYKDFFDYEKEYDNLFNKNNNEDLDEFKKLVLLANMEVD